MLKQIPLFKSCPIEMENPVKLCVTVFAGFVMDSGD
jgi:hypothetical protein